ncbi:NTP transferase domain-containing protein [Candidatus Woesebacteria bacterium]|nr:NTP transferase domain-containing protein [Candidatus Woesebacteria bacterium]
MNLNTTAAIVLAAGRGTRMKAKKKNKVAFNLHGKPMVAHTVDNLIESGVAQIIAVVGFAAESVKEALGDSVDYATQSEPLGTGHALKAALPHLAQGIDTVLTVYGDDSAFYPVSLYQEMVQELRDKKCDLLFLTIHKDDPTGLGRIVRSQRGGIERIVEEKNATDEERKIQEINTGFYCFDRSFLEEYIDQIQKNPLTGEYYATDMVEIALRNQKKVSAYFRPDSSIWHGVNNRSDYSRAQKKANNA